MKTGLLRSKPVTPSKIEPRTRENCIRIGKDSCRNKGPWCSTKTIFLFVSLGNSYIMYISKTYKKIFDFGPFLIEGSDSVFLITVTYREKIIAWFVN